MDELIAQLTEKLGIDASVANDATGKAMSLLKEHAGDDLFAKISSAIPGAGDAASQAVQQSATAAGDGGSMFSKIAGMASSALGGSGGGGLELGAALASSGLDTGQISGLVGTVIEFIREKAGDEVVDQILAKVPMLQSLLD